MRKLVLVGGIGIVVAVAAGITLLVTGLGSVVGYAIEKSGSAVTETRVRVAGVDLKLREGRCAIEGVRVASPANFEAPDVFVLNGISVDLDVDSVRKDPVVVKEIRIRAPEVHAEFLKDGSSNVDQIRKNAMSHTGAAGGGDGKGAPPRRLRVESFVFEGGTIDVDASALGVEQRSVTLPAFRIDGVGGEAGVPADEVAQVLVAELAKRAAASLAADGIEQLVEKRLGGSVKDAVKGLLDRK